MAVVRRIHGNSSADPGAGHQTETRATDPRAWDRELVPTAAGRTARPEPDCPVEAALAAVSGRWTTLVLRELTHGPQSFGTLRDRLPGISPKVLAERLHTLRDRGLVRQERLPGFPTRTRTRTRYTLTAAGRALRPLLVELYRTGARLTDLTGEFGEP